MKLSIPAVTLVALTAGTSACTFGFRSNPSTGCRFLWSLDDDIYPWEDPRMPLQEVACQDACIVTQIGAHDYELCVNGRAVPRLDEDGSLTVQRLGGGDLVEIWPDGGFFWQNPREPEILSYARNNVGCPDLAG